MFSAEYSEGRQKIAKFGTTNHFICDGIVEGRRGKACLDGWENRKIRLSLVVVNSNLTIFRPVTLMQRQCNPCRLGQSVRNLTWHEFKGFRAYHDDFWKHIRRCIHAKAKS